MLKALKALRLVCMFDVVIVAKIALTAAVFEGVGTENHKYD